MPLDHYVSQVHLKRFNADNLKNERMWGLKKGAEKVFPAHSKEVCRIQDGSTNSYLSDERIIEKFLKEIEPKYNSAIEKIEAGNIDDEDIYVISGIVSYILTCSPAGMRINKELFKVSVEEASKKVKLPPAPEALDGKSLEELIEEGVIGIEIDEKYPQAVGISSIFSHLIVFGNSDWEILINQDKSSPFFTSDFPVCIEKTSDPRVLNRIFPLTPYLALRIKPSINLSESERSLNFEHHSHKVKKLKHKDIVSINKLIVRSAESIVFSPLNEKWVSKFVSKNSNYRIEAKTQTIATKSSSLILFSQEISEYNQTST